MTPDGPTEELLRRILTAVSSNRAASGLIADARSEAELEVRSLLKSAFKAALLRQVVGELEHASPQSPAEAVVNEPAPELPQAQKRADSADTGCYLYAITPAVHGGTAPPLTAIDPAFPLELIIFGEVQAIVSRVSLEQFGKAALNDRIADRQWVEASVRAHDEVVKAAMVFGAVIPCRFCTILRSFDDVRGVLATHRDQIVSTLGSLAGQSEWGVKLSYSPRLAGDAAPPTVSGADYLRHKQQAQDRRREDEREARDRALELHESLSAKSSKATRLPLRQSSDASAAGQQLLNTAYLVAEPDADRFHAIMNDWADLHAPEGWRVELTGPWPPYNFADLDLSPEVVT